ncbi:hypothetical protein SHLA_8c000200 [Shinella sp. DD12]|jgi:putative tricarboxylic transport membrane protein|nr:hypothetical protein SHLA_8c000200 [Shinella sp. DD12]
MDFLNLLALGFSEALTPTNLGFCLLGALLGTLIGVLPGIGPTATIAVLLPITFYLPPLAGLIMLAGIYYGAQYGGSTTAILVNLPGEASSVVTAIDGYKMAQKGRAGSALAVAALGSFFAGTVATFGIAIAGPTLSSFALSFGPAEYVSLMLFGLLAATVLARGPVLKAIGMILLGLLLGMVGIDASSGEERLTFSAVELFDGIDFVVIAIGLFGFTEIIENLENHDARGVLVSKFSRLWPTREDFRRAWPAVLRGTGVGTFLGVLPGGGATLASFCAYSVEKKISKTPEEFGEGAVEGVAGPEAANSRRTVVVHPAADPRNSLQQHDGDDAERVHHPRHHARPDRARHPAGDILGSCGQHVDRQPDAGRDQSADDRHLGETADGALPSAIPRDPPVLLRWRL